MVANDRQVGGAHYGGTDYQHWDWVNDCRMPYLAGVGSKYIARAYASGKSVQDLEKAVHYAEKCCEVNPAVLPVVDRMAYFWRFAITNKLRPEQAAICWYFMEGEWEAAKAACVTALEATRKAQQPA